MDYALIGNDIVANLIWLHPMNASDFPTAVAVGSLPVQIGDSYRSGKFYREGMEITETLKNNADAVIDSIIQEVKTSE